ncbi:MAG: hypothetical protein E7048_07750 [Lentisphaerae bacterium]|nr:hypothetical protein [Lentisphaerota bacterium]
MEKKPRILFIGAHHEEIEAECPNTAAALTLAGCEVTILNPVGGWNWTFIRSLGENGRERTIADATAAAAELGCKKVIWDYPVAQADRYRDEMMDRMAQFLVDYSPEIVFIHWPRDSHADHRIVAHVSRHILGPAVNIIPGSAPDFKPPVEVYAYQTGVGQAYNFIPDVLVTTDSTTMAMADRCIDCFNNTAPTSVPHWKKNFHTKAAYWSNLSGTEGAEAFKFLGPRLPLTGFRLKEILGERMQPAPLEIYNCNPDFQL